MIIGYGYLTQQAKRICLTFYSNGRIMIDGEQYVGEPLFLDSLLILDFVLFEKYFSAWDD